MAEVPERFACDLPDTLRWHEYQVVPPYRDDPQDKVTVLLRRPGFHEPTDDEYGGVCEAARRGYHCVTHDRPWSHGGGDCPDHDHHEIALVCGAHGFEVLDPQPLMLVHPAGFDPPLTDSQLAAQEA